MPEPSSGPAPEANRPRGPDEQAPAGPAPARAAPLFVASCQNCTRFAEGSCGLGRVLAPGKLLCNDYEITAAFRDQLVSVMMQDIMAQVRTTAHRVQKLRAAQRLWN